jgi:hypothetical protein
MFPLEKSPKISFKYFCKTCNYKCCKQSEYNKHILTNKHKILQNPTSDADKKVYTCNCGKIYKHSSTLYAHKKTCKIEENVETNEPQIDINDKDQLIMMLIKQNAELIKEQGNIRQMIAEQQNIVLEIAKNGTHNTTNSHNKSFNLQFFLNETCKDAMNIMDFVESIQLQISDLEKVGEMGYINGISNIIIKNLNQLDITQRPVHCTDKKREILYIRDEDKWEKNDDENKKIRKAIKKVANKNIRMLQKFKEEHPDCGKSDSKYSDQYNKIIVESMGGAGDNDTEKEDKIIKNITKEVVIDKTQF